jgi:hypothetical protein
MQVLLGLVVVLSSQSNCIVLMPGSCTMQTRTALSS